MDHLAYRHALAAQLQASELPFPPQEFALRRHRVRQAMQDAQLDALVLGLK